MSTGYVVWKFPLVVTDHQVVTMRGAAQSLHVAMQDGILTLWARVNPEGDFTTRAIRVTGTGLLAPAPSEGEYIGTVFDGPFVWHVFDCGPA